jgi:hypothetical protein
VPVQSRQAHGGSGVLDLGRLHVAGTPRLGGQQPDHPAVGQVRQRVDQRVDQVAVTVAPPEDRGVDDVLHLLVDQLGPGEILHRSPQVGVHVVVVPELLDDLALAKPEPTGHRLLCRRLRRRAHLGNLLAIRPITMIAPGPLFAPVFWRCLRRM